jgi:linoleoyl-CoA desaturase
LNVWNKIQQCQLTYPESLARSSQQTSQGSILGSFLFAIFGWFLGALGHDAGHFSVSHSAWINTAAVWAMSLLCNPILWQHQHTYAHHSFTNSFHHDPDLHHFETLLRVHRRFQKKSIYANQSSLLYVLFAFTFVVVGTCIWIPWSMIQQGSLYGLVVWTDRKRPLRTAGLLLHLAAYLGLIVVLPFLVHASWWSAWASVAIHVSTSGLIFALFSQINHLNEASLKEDSTTPLDEISTSLLQLRNSWAVSQIEASNNFATHSSLWHVLSNGLNLQIEHHLFPGLNHCHLHRIAPVVQQTCEEYNVPYKRFDDWTSIFSATREWLRRLATEDDE